MNTEPTPTWLRASREPSMICAYCRLMARPRPVLPGCLAPALGLHEGLEDRVQFVLGDAGPGVFHLNLQVAVHHVRPQRHRPLSGELDGVAQQVDEDLPQLALVGTHEPRHGIVGSEGEGEAVLGSPQMEHLVEFPQ